MLGCAYYRQIYYLTLMCHHSNSVTYISSCKHINIIKHPFKRNMYIFVNNRRVQINAESNVFKKNKKNKRNNNIKKEDVTTDTAGGN